MGLTDHLDSQPSPRGVTVLIHIAHLFFIRRLGAALFDDSCSDQPPLEPSSRTGYLLISVVTIGMGQTSSLQLSIHLVYPCFVQ